MKTILFSPIGSTDPISGQHDGALLHIIRKYKPDKVYLYLSKEICELEAMDNRYSYCLEALKNHLGIDFEIEWIKKESLTDVHLFDFFLEEFRVILTDIYDDESRVLLNVSSGTPAMKSALQILSCFFDRPLLPVQVSTPEKKINERENIKGDYDPELQWACNMDNGESFRDRCTVSSVINMSVEMGKNEIKKHLFAYDYAAAERTADSIKDFLNPKAIDLIKAGNLRLKLDFSECEKIFKVVGYDFFPVKASDEKPVFEAVMLLLIKLKKEEYADFLRSISPIFFVLMERILETSGEIRLSDYVYTESNKNVNNVYIKKWNSEKVNKELLFADADLRCDFNRVVNSEDYVKLINNSRLNSKTKALVEGLRKVEINIRNTAAHDITCITDNYIRQCTGKTSAQIYKDIKELAVISGIKIKEEYLNTYDDLNDKIIEYINANC